MLRGVVLRNSVGVSYLCSGCLKENVFERWMAEHQPLDGESRVLHVSGDLGNGFCAIENFQEYLTLFGTWMNVLYQRMLPKYLIG